MLSRHFSVLIISAGLCPFLASCFTLRDDLDMLTKLLDEMDKRDLANNGTADKHQISTSPVDQNRDKRLMVKRFRNWPDAVVAYTFADGAIEDGRISLAYNKYNKEEILNSMRLYERFTCARFPERTSEEYYIQFVNFDYGLWSMVGAHSPTRTSSPIRSIDKDSFDGECYSCVHEIGHALGFTHEAQSPDEDKMLMLRQSYLGDEWEDNSKSRVWDVGYDSTNFQSDGSRNGFREMHVGAQITQFYMLKELSLTMECQTLRCPDYEMTTCDNEGYVTLVYGKMER